MPLFVSSLLSLFVFEGSGPRVTDSTCAKTNLPLSRDCILYFSVSLTVLQLLLPKVVYVIKVQFLQFSIIWHQPEPSDWNLGINWQSLVVSVSILPSTITYNARFFKRLWSPCVEVYTAAFSQVLSYSGILITGQVISERSLAVSHSFWEAREHSTSPGFRHTVWSWFLSLLTLHNVLSSHETVAYLHLHTLQVVPATCMYVNKLDKQASLGLWLQRVHTSTSTYVTHRLTNK